MEQTDTTNTAEPLDKPFYLTFRQPDGNGGSTDWQTAKITEETFDKLTGGDDIIIERNGQRFVYDDAAGETVFYIPALSFSFDDNGVLTEIGNPSNQSGT